MVAGRNGAGTSDSSAPAMPQAGNGTMALLAIAAFAGHMAPFIYLPALPTIAAEFAASEAAVQLTLTLFLVGSCVGLVAYGPLTDRFGDGTMLIAGGVLFAVASLGCAVAPDLASLNAARFVQGIGSIAGMVTARAAIITLYPRPVAMRLLGVLSGVLALSPALGPLIGSLIQLAFDWRQGFVLLAIAVLISSLWAGIAVRRTSRRPPSGSTVLASLGRLARSHRFRVGIGMVAITNASFVVFMAMAPFAFVDRAGMGPLTFSSALAGCLVLFAISSIVTGRRAGALGPRRAAMIGLPIVLVSLIGLTAAALTDASPWWAFASLALLFPGLGCMVPTGHMTMLAPFTDITGTAASIGVLVMTLSGAVALGLIGWLVPSSMLAIALVFAGAWVITVRLVLWLPSTV